MSSKEIVTTIIDGTEVECKVIHRSSGDFGIEITKPFQNITGGLHIPYFGRPYSNFDGEYGDESILYTLNEIYELGSYLSENMINLQENVRELDCEIANLSSKKIGEKEYRRKRIQLRRVLRNGGISNWYYQKILNWWKDEKRSLEMDICSATDMFFENNFPMIVPCSTRDEVLDILRDNKTLNVDSPDL